ncbi:MAG: VCBS repeat-containing protein [Calditrichaeota bacterium]|nr:MAG: VCBS repeat-containing protein [Calditrichota bacterium]
MGTENGKVLILNGRSGKIETVFDFNDEVSKATGDYVAVHPIRAALALGEIEGDGQVELVVGSTSSHYLAVEGKTLRRIWHQQLPVKSSRTTPAMGPVLGRFDDDDLPDILLVSNAKLQVIRGSAERNNAKQTFWLFDVPGDDELVTPATLADLNKDGAVDVFIGTRNGTLLCFDGADGEVLAEIANEANPIVSPILIADLNSDGLNDLLFMRKDGNIYRVQTTSPLAKNDVVWGQAFADAGHTCLYRYQPPQPTTSNVLTATFGCLLLFAGGLTYMGRQKREKTIRQNQSHAY